MPEYPDFLATWQVICARAWTDDAFKQELLGNPNQTLSNHGFPPPANMNFGIVENDEQTLNLVLPLPPGKVAQIANVGDRTISQYQASCL